MRALLAATLVGALLLAGCIAPPSLEPQDTTVEPAGTTDVPLGTMTVGETNETAECFNDDNDQACRAKEVLLDGAMNLESLDVQLLAMNGVNVAGGPAGAWSLLVHMEATGASDSDAQENLDRMRLDWTHEEDGEHVLHARVVFEPAGLVPIPNIVSIGETTPQMRSRMTLVIPSDTLATLDLETTSGGIDINGLRTDGITATTTSGGIGIQADVTSVTASTTSGGIEAALVPTAAGTIKLSTTSGGVEVTIPEGRRYGYEIDASANSGGVEIDLQDGVVNGDKNHKTFSTDGFSTRSIRTTMDLDTSSGGVDVSPR